MSLIEQANSNTKREPGKKETSVARAEDDITETPNRIRSVGFGGLDTIQGRNSASVIMRIIVH
jgi:hypothetical protein